ncbi:ABC-2 type transport system ATP-binding protein [Motilibacter rhizosphaerae]|uniref:ABC-2 type transport system ATP-binding protein n=1 Tax=Motilibacter rhizosphaerae TaxID=598652 RepID=A0A4Q7NXA7_9ACTN|nr:ATP-binding cassette domain-containing protein [Motilibacter rhizosphaerae]RZS91032.1 ABC-2 type transport system ATP-binding protein [Motilibacter rhizosphaerae]
MALIEVRDLTKEFVRPKRVEGRFGTLRTLVTREVVRTSAVSGVSFDVDEGEVVGYLGPNGAGKSTTIKLLTGILTPTSGTVAVHGPLGTVVPWRDRERNARQVGVVFGQRSQLWWDLPLVESLRLVAALYDVPDERYRRNRDRLVDLLDMGSFLDTPVRQLSLGQRMRGDLAAALLYEPPILYLDEPTVGLDVLAKQTVRQFVAEANEISRTTVMLTTHDLEDVERLCRRIVLIDRGTVLYDGSVDGLIARYAPFREVLVTPDTSSAKAALPGEVWELGGAVGTRDGDAWRFRIGRDEPVHALITAVTAAYPVRDVRVVDASLETVMTELYAERRVPSEVAT